MTRPEDPSQNGCRRDGDGNARIFQRSFEAGGLGLAHGCFALADPLQIVQASRMSA